jgi:hypothetical protein
MSAAERQERAMRKLVKVLKINWLHILKEVGKLAQKLYSYIVKTIRYVFKNNIPDW